MSEIENYICLAQGLFYLLTGVWALVSIDTFQKVTGPKTDLWLVKTVGVLVSVIGIGLISAGIRNNISVEIFFIAVGSAAVLTMIDIYYVSRKVISKIYLLDAAVEIFLIGCWLIL
jgi:energy-converting hydrogenase Eha subunit E